MVFEGCFTAIVTPFKGSGVRAPVDWDSFRALLEFQDENGTSGIVACGSTGESATLSIEEHNEVIGFVADNSRGATIAGTGSNSTWEAVEMTRHAQDVGAAASLQVCPYYNKPNQEGLYQHFAKIAESVEMPIILYNVPSRTAREIAPSTMARLAEEYSNVIGVKEASGKMETWEGIRRECPKDFVILSGNDGDSFALMKDYGAKGVISVASNLIPKDMADFVALGLDGRFQEMQKEHERLSEAFDILFIDTNPIPIKYAMNSRGLGAGGYRLPLCETTAEKKKQIDGVLSRLR
ncbi:MAG: 4-hydroxy-tetrahydrodipicolinate synthase [Candidatus Hydrothermarchaeales archaeon]